MAIAKKGSRRIVVDGVPYRWKVRKKPTYSQANTWTNFNLSVEQMEAKGSVLFVELPHAHPSNWMGEPSLPVLPSDVERLIKDALAMGWQPAQAGKTFALTK